MTTGYLLLGSVAIRETFRLQNCDGSSSEFHVMFHLLHFSMGIRHHSIHQTTHINLMPVNTSTRAFPEFRTLDCKLIRPIFSLSHVQYWAYYWCTTDKFEVPRDSHLSEKNVSMFKKRFCHSLAVCSSLRFIYSADDEPFSVMGVMCFSSWMGWPQMLLNSTSLLMEDKICSYTISVVPV